jgi:hypothetical protein
MDLASPEMWRMVGEACLVGFYCGLALMVVVGIVMSFWASRQRHGGEATGGAVSGDGRAAHRSPSETRRDPPRGAAAMKDARSSSRQPLVFGPRSTRGASRPEDSQR